MLSANVTTIRTSQGVPTSENAPNTFLRRAGTGTNAAPINPATHQRAASTWLVAASPPRTMDAPAIHASATGEPIRATSETIHAIISPAARVVTIQPAHGRTIASNREGRFTVANTPRL